MLKLSSNYAKSFIRETSGQQPQRTRMTGTERFYPSPSEHDFDLPKKSMLQDSDPRRERFDYKQPSSSEFKHDFAISNDAKGNKDKPYGYGYQNGGNPRNDDYRQDIGEYQRKAKNYDEPYDIDSNYRDKSPRTYNSKRNNLAGSYQPDLPPQNENFEPDLKSFKYSKYSGRPTPLQPTYGLQKKQYTVKHTRRNQQVKNRILKQQNYVKDPYSKNYYEQRQPTAYDNYLNDGGQNYDNYRNQQDYREPKQDYQNTYKNSRRLQFDTFDKQDDWKNQRQPRNNYEIGNSSQPQYPEDLVAKQKVDDYAQDRFDRPSLNQRKQSIKKSIQGTPQKGYKGMFEPGSAERKNSLIQKSQMLQQKLKKLNMQYPAGERQKETNSIEQRYQPQAQRPVSRNQIPQQNDDIYSRYTPSPHIQTSISNRSSSCLKNNFRNINIGQGQRDITSSIRNVENARNKSPILDSEHQVQLPIKGEAIEKITKLNEKINERIQSIISNYAKK